MKMQITANPITTRADKSEGTAKPHKTMPGTIIFTAWMTAIGKSTSTINRVGICISLLFPTNASKNQPSNLQTNLWCSHYDSPSPDAFLPLKIRGGKTTRSGSKKNPALLLSLKII